MIIPLVYLSKWNKTNIRTNLMRTLQPTNQRKITTTWPPSQKRPSTTMRPPWISFARPSPSSEAPSRCRRRRRKWPRARPPRRPRVSTCRTSSRPCSPAASVREESRRSGRPWGRRRPKMRPWRRPSRGFPSSPTRLVRNRMSKLNEYCCWKLNLRTLNSEYINYRIPQTSFLFPFSPTRSAAPTLPPSPTATRLPLSRRPRWRRARGIPGAAAPRGHGRGRRRRLRASLSHGVCSGRRSSPTPKPTVPRAQAEQQPAIPQATRIRELTR